MDNPKTPPKYSCRSYGVYLLSKREYTADQLRRKMNLKGYAPEEVDDALRFLQEYNFQSDERFAGAYSRGAENRLGNRRLMLAMTSKGVTPEVAEEAIAELGSEEERAYQAARRFENLSIDFEVEQKIWRFLSYRGFSSKAIRTVVSQLKELQPPD